MLSSCFDKWKLHYSIRNTAFAPSKWLNMQRALLVHGTTCDATSTTDILLPHCNRFGCQPCRGFSTSRGAATVMITSTTSLSERTVPPSRRDGRAATGQKRETTTVMSRLSCWQRPPQPRRLQAQRPLPRYQ